MHTKNVTPPLVIREPRNIWEVWAAIMARSWRKSMSYYRTAGGRFPAFRCFAWSCALVIGLCIVGMHGERLYQNAHGAPTATVQDAATAYGLAFRAAFYGREG